MAEEKKLTEEQKEQIKAEVKEQVDRLGEVFSQCWESDEFKQAFIADPKAIFKEYGVNFADDKEYVVIDSPEKTFIKVLPYEGIKGVLREYTENWMKKVEELDEKEGKQIIVDGWKELIYQNTPDKFYIAIPHCPDSLTPEELEMVNGGCIFSAIVIFFELAVVATTVAAAAEVAAVVFEVAALATAVAAMGAMYSVVLTVTVLMTSNMATTGAIVTADTTMLNVMSNSVLAYNETTGEAKLNGKKIR